MAEDRVIEKKTLPGRGGILVNFHQGKPASRLLIGQMHGWLGIGVTVRAIIGRCAWIKEAPFFSQHLKLPLFPFLTFGLDQFLLRSVTTRILSIFHHRASPYRPRFRLLSD
jgi:hypothetical protein